MFANQNEINRLLTDIYLAFLSIVNLLTSEVRVMAQYLKDAWQPFIAAGEIALFEQRFDDAVLNFQMALLDAEIWRKIRSANCHYSRSALRDLPTVEST
jgi:hypothetical protein